MDGLSRFDGYQFTNFGVDQGLLGHISTIVEAQGGSYWVATWDGLYRFRPAATGSRFTSFRPADPKARATYALATDGGGGLWAGTQGGLYHLEELAGQWRLHFVDIGMPNRNWDDTAIETLLMDRRGNLWAGGLSGLYRRWPDGHTDHYTTRDGLPHTHVGHLREDHNGQIWVGTWGGLCKFSITGLGRSSIEKVAPAKAGIAGNVVTALYESSDGTLWIGTGDGLSERTVKDGIERFESYTTANGLISNQIWSIGEDRAGNLWLGSNGVMRLTRAGFVTYTEQDGLASDFVISILEDQKGELCALTKPSDHTASNPTVFNVFDGERFHPVRPNMPGNQDYYGWAYRQPALQDRKGAWWIATGQGIYRYPPTSSIADLARVRPESFYASRGNLPGEDVVRIFEDSRGDVWIGTYAGPTSPINGVARWDRISNSLRRYQQMESVSFDRLADTFEEDRAGNLWIGFHTGQLGRYRHGEFRVFTKADGLPFGAVNCLHLDMKGRLWVGGDRGVVRIDSPDAAVPGFVRYGTAEGLATNIIRSIADDAWGRIYIGTDRGVDCFSTRTALHVRHYGPIEGLSRGIGVSFRDRHGAIWFACGSGLSRIEPRPDNPTPAPSVLISALKIRGENRNVSALGETNINDLQLAPDQNQLLVEFVGLSFAPGEKLRYQYRLEGADQSWSPATDQRSVNYASLSPGSYQFQVRAVSTDGLLSDRPASIAFVIETHIWQRLWFRMLLLTLVASLLYAFYRYRLGRLLEMERLRTRIATDLHDDVGSTLSQIAILSEVATRRIEMDDRTRGLPDIAHLSRELIDSMSDIVWAINPEEDRLDDLAHRMRRFANDLLAASGVYLQFRVADGGRETEVGADMRRQIFLIFKEGLNNAVRHSGCTGVQIDISLTDGVFCLVLRDNGRGFEWGCVTKGHGLSSMGQRAAQLGGSLDVDSRPNHGTTIALQVPLKRTLILRWKELLHKHVVRISRVRRTMKP